MNRSALVLPILALFACSGESTDDTGTTGNEMMSFDLSIQFIDGALGSTIQDAEICLLIPEGAEEPCETTNTMGRVNMTFETSGYTDVLSRLTHEDYQTTLYTGRFDEEVHEGWTETLETSDTIEAVYWSFKSATVENYMASGGLVMEDGLGHMFYWVGLDNSGTEGVVATLENEDGESVGQVAYQAANTAVLDADLTATTTAGWFSIINIEPGEYTLTVSHDEQTCESGFAYISDVPDTVTVPVEADSVTMGTLLCSAE
ncbi:MAG: hypothetical protein QGG40_10185 [Myxococcota bacterium]|nr:hypothetical protein [Myxococcota bacterium]